MVMVETVNTEARDTTDTTGATDAIEAHRYRLPADFIPQHTLEEIRAFTARFPAWGVNHIFRMLPGRFDLAGMQVLDLGCGIALQALHFVEEYHVAGYHGIDPDRDTWYGGHNSYGNYIPYKHALASYYPERMNFYSSISEDMPFPDNSFDFVFAAQTTEHVQDIFATCREVRRVLKPGGYFYASHHNFYAWDGHHQGPYTVNDLVHASPDQMRYQGWNHLDMDIDWSEPHHLNRITIHDLEAALRASLRIVTWDNVYTTRERGADLLTQAILDKYAGRYDFEDLATTMIEVVVKNNKPE